MIMVKRRERSEDECPHSKRQKTKDGSASFGKADEIQSPHDLQVLLAFEQDAGPQVRQSMIPSKVCDESLLISK